MKRTRDGQMFSIVINVSEKELNEVFLAYIEGLPHDSSKLAAFLNQKSTHILGHIKTIRNKIRSHLNQEQSYRLDLLYLAATAGLNRVRLRTKASTRGVVSLFCLGIVSKTSPVVMSSVIKSIWPSGKLLPHHKDFFFRHWHTKLHSVFPVVLKLQVKTILLIAARQGSCLSVLSKKLLYFLIRRVSCSYRQHVSDTASLKTAEKKYARWRAWCEHFYMIGSIADCLHLLSPLLSNFHILSTV